MPECTCPTACDCQNPNGAIRLVSEHCPVHSERPYPDPDCPIFGTHNNGAVDLEAPTPAPKRTREESAEMVLRSMVADMRRQGWTLSNQAADELVERLKKEILQ